MVEFGDIRLSANERRKRTREESCREIVDMHRAKRKSVKEIQVEFPHYGRDVEILQCVRHGNRTNKPNVMYVYGVNGCGKTTSTLNVSTRLLLDFYVKPRACKWWPSYDQQTVCLIEEFQSCFPLSSCNCVSRIPSKGSLKEDLRSSIIQLLCSRQRLHRMTSMLRLRRRSR